MILLSEERNKPMLKRKIETHLAEWHKSEARKPLVIKGIRQCGKTYIVRKFANENYENVVYVNFILEPDKNLLLQAILMLTPSFSTFPL